MVVVTFCRPHRRAGWVVVALLAGAAAVLLTGSRGAWPGLAVIAVVALLAGGWRVRFPPWLWLLFACLLSVVAWFSAPLVLSRMDALQRDAVRYDTGDVNSRSEEHTSELQSLMRISYAVFCLNKKNNSS